MSIRWIGAILVIVGCGSFGIMFAISHKREVSTLNQLMNVLDYMEHQLRYQMTPLPDLFGSVYHVCHGVVKEFFLKLSVRLEEQNAPNVSQCVSETFNAVPGIPKSSFMVLSELGSSLGAFDLDGQINAIDSAKSSCKKHLEYLTKNQDERLRSYQTLGLCAGAALAILLV